MKKERKKFFLLSNLSLFFLHLPLDGKKEENGGKTDEEGIKEEGKGMERRTMER